MTDDEIIRMAQEAARSADSRLLGCGMDDLERFAALAAAAAIERLIPKLADLWDMAPNAIAFDDMRREAAAIRAMND